jgi:hypothetical protein
VEERRRVETIRAFAERPLHDYTLDGYQVEILEQPKLNAFGVLAVKARASFRGRELPDDADHGHWFTNPSPVVGQTPTARGHLYVVDHTRALQRLLLESLLASARAKGWTR